MVMGEGEHSIYLLWRRWTQYLLTPASWLESRLYFFLIEEVKHHIVLCIMRTHIFVCIIHRVINAHSMYSLYPCIKCILIFPSKIWARNCTLYTEKYGISSNSVWKEKQQKRVPIKPSTGLWRPNAYFLLEIGRAHSWEENILKEDS